MRTMSLVAGVLCFVLFVTTTTRSLAGDKTTEVKIKTSMHCDDCKQKIEKELTSIAGVQSVESDLTSKVVTVKFDNSKTSQDKLIESIKKLGYTAEVYNADATQSGGCQKKCGRKSACSGK